MYHHNMLATGRGHNLTMAYVGDSRSERIHPKRPDHDPMDHKGHGTHVAGIIAGENEWQVPSNNHPPSTLAEITDHPLRRFTGVAPGAELLIYKVFSDVCSTYPLVNHGL